MKEALKWIIANKDMLVEIGGLIAFLISQLNSSARGAIAAVFKIMQSAEMEPEQAKQKASDLMGKKWPFIPEGLRKMIIQIAFDSAKKAVVDPKV